jgi:hypothetical protein
MSDAPLGSDLLRDRLVLAAINALTKDDPLLMIGLGDNEIRLGWADERQPNEDFQPYCLRCGIPHTTECKRETNT